MSTAYHPETDGQAEAVNKQILQIQRAFDLEGKNWAYTYPLIQSMINNSTDASRKCAPSVALLGYYHSMNPKTDPPILKSYISCHSFRHKQIHDNLGNAKLQQAKQANNKRRAAPLFFKGDKVMLFTKNLITSTSKLKPLWSLHST